MICINAEESGIIYCVFAHPPLCRFTHRENRASRNYKCIFQFLFFNEVSVMMLLFHVHQRAYPQIL